MASVRLDETQAERWLELFDAFAIAQTARGIAPGTLTNRTKHVRQFLAAVQLPADHVTYEDYRGWLDSLNCSRHRAAALRTSLRAFFRWAQAAGRAHHDPTAEPEYVTGRAPVPDTWVPILAAYAGYQRGIGRPSTTIGTTRAQLARFAREHPRLAPAEISSTQMLDWLAEKRWAQETRRAHRSTLRTFYSWMLETGRVDDDPAARLPVIRRSRHLPRPALEDEYARALERADGRERIALRLAAELGLRCAEVAAVHSRDLMHTPAGPVLRVRGKGSHDRQLPLTEGLARMLRTLPPGYALPGQIAGHISAHYLGKLISRLLPEGVTMHALRHRFATLGYESTGDVLAVQAALGHASPDTTMVYVQLSQARSRALVDAVAAAGR